MTRPKVIALHPINVDMWQQIYQPTSLDIDIVGSTTEFLETLDREQHLIGVINQHAYFYEHKYNEIYQFTKEVLDTGLPSLILVHEARPSELNGQNIARNRALGGTHIAMPEEAHAIRHYLRNVYANAFYGEETMGLGENLKKLQCFAVEAPSTEPAVGIDFIF